MVEYVGEIVTTKEATKRLSNYDKFRLNYLLVIRETARGIITRTNIDATNYSNVARFLNHSCEPNLIAQVVRIESLVPQVGLFACQNIKTGEELTFDYGSVSWDNIPGNYPCYCGSSNCRGTLPFTPNI